jgi:acetylornithine/N-succinyldiaminopimelate aminotransferase
MSQNTVTPKTNIPNTSRPNTATQEKVIQETENHYFPVFQRTSLVVQCASGCSVWDMGGRHYLDLTSGWGVTALGHSPPALVEAIRHQAGLCLQAPNCNLSYTPAQAGAAARLVATLPGDLSQVFFTNSGTEATETAIKIVRRAKGSGRFIACQGSFHGRTTGATALIGQEHYRQPFEPLLPRADFVPFGDAAAVAAVISPETAAIIVEPIQGEGGVHPAPKGYLKTLRSLATANGVPLIFDEIQTGIGRTGPFFACQDEEVTPDILLIGKGLGGGFPVGAVAVTPALAATMQKGDHGGTYAGNPLACAAVEAVLQAFEDGKVLENGQRRGRQAVAFLQELKGSYPQQIVEVRGRGLLLGCEMASEALAAAVVEHCFDAGVLLNRVQGKVIRLFPALTIGSDELEQGLNALATALAQISTPA